MSINIYLDDTQKSLAESGDIAAIQETVEEVEERFSKTTATITHTIPVTVSTLDSQANAYMGVLVPKNTKFKMTCSCDFDYTGDSFQINVTDDALYKTIDTQSSSARCHTAPVTVEYQYATADIANVRMQFNHMAALSGNVTITVEFDTGTAFQMLDNMPVKSIGANKFNPAYSYKYVMLNTQQPYIFKASYESSSIGFVPIKANGYVSFNKSVTCVIVSCLFDGSFNTADIQNSVKTIYNNSNSDACVLFYITTSDLTGLMAVDSQYPADYIPYNEMGGWSEKPLDDSYGIIGHYYPEEIDKIKRLEGISGALRFVHLSDTHATGTNPITYADQFTDLSNATFAVITGDLINNTFDNDFTNLKNQILGMEKPCYVILGNHDVWNSTNQQERYDKFFNPLAEHNDTPEDKSYYSVDFATEKVKCIFLDVYDESTGDPSHKMSSAQINWFLGELDDAITNSYHVCVFLHEPIKSSDPAVDDFWDKDFNGSSDLYWIADVIAAFKTGSSVSFTHNSNSYTHTFSSAGVFVAYFAGHTHYDCVGWLKGYDKQLSITIDRNLIGSDVTWYDEKLKCVMNYVSVRSSTRQVGVIRIGNENTRYGGEKSGFWIRY